MYLNLKKIFALLLLIAFITLPTTFAAAAGKPTVAILPFADQSARSAGSAKHKDAVEDSYEYVRTAIEQTNRFRVMTRTEIMQVLDEIKFERSGLVDISTAAQYGKMIGAQYIIVGNVTGIARRGSEIFANLSLRMVEVETAEVFLSGRGKGKSKYDETEALENAADDALNGKMGMFTMMRGGRK